MVLEADFSPFIDRRYILNTEQFITYFSLIPISEDSGKYLGSLYGRYHNIGNGIVFATTNNFPAIQMETPLAVIGGPCISDCYESLTFEAAMDITNVISVSKILESQGLVYIGIEEERIKDDSKNWSEVGNSIERFVRRLCGIMDYDRIELIRTDSDNVRTAMKIFLPLLEDVFSEEMLSSLYDFPKKDNSKRILKHLKPEMYRTYRMNIATYLPTFVSEITGDEIRQVVVAENSYQINAVKFALNFMRNMDQSNSTYGPFFLVHLPVPDISGKKRMYRSSMSKKLFLGKSRGDLESKIDKTKGKSLNYWFNIIPPEIKVSMDDTEDFLDVMELLTQLYMN